MSVFIRMRIYDSSCCSIRSSRNTVNSMLRIYYTGANDCCCHIKVKYLACAPYVNIYEVLRATLCIFFTANGAFGLHLKSNVESGSLHGSASTVSRIPLYATFPNSLRLILLHTPKCEKIVAGVLCDLF
jgi:hypothetical protein